MNYTLLDGVAQNAAHPDTYEIPSWAQKARLKPSQFVKLCFEESGENSERMWVQLTAIDGNDFEGTLANTPFRLRSVQFGDAVKFNSKHIIGIMEG